MSLTFHDRYYITGSPQCPFPDANLGPTLNAVGFDAIYVQFCKLSKLCALNEWQFTTIRRQLLRSPDVPWLQRELQRELRRERPETLLFRVFLISVHQGWNFAEWYLRPHFPNT